MPIMHEVKFEYMPKQSTFQNQLQQVTGLPISVNEIKSGENWWSYSVKLGESEKAIILYDSVAKKVNVTTMSIVHTYIFYSTIHTLEELGGRLMNKPFLPHWKGKQWKEKKWWHLTMIL